MKRFFLPTYLYILIIPWIFYFAGAGLNWIAVASNKGVMPVYEKACLDDPNADENQPGLADLTTVDPIHRCATKIGKVHFSWLTDTEWVGDGTASAGDDLMSLGQDIYVPSFYIWGTLCFMALYRKSI